MSTVDRDREAILAKLDNAVRAARLDRLATNLIWAGTLCAAFHHGEVYGYVTHLLQHSDKPNLNWQPNLLGEQAP